MINLLAVSFLSIFAIQAIFFAWAFLNKSDKVTDLAYGSTFVLMVIGLLFYSQTFFPTQLLVTLLVTLWGVRIVGYLFFRIHKIGKDARFDGIRERFWSFGQFWFLQAVAIWVILLPATYILRDSSRIDFGVWSLVGLVIWIVGFFFESVADYQKYVFKSNPKNKELFISSGLWSISRHPNYLGEMLMWWGIFIIGIPHFMSGPLATWIVIIGPIFITYLLLFVTGIPPLEKKYNQRYKKNSAYQNYKKNTPLLIPFMR